MRCALISLVIWILNYSNCDIKETVDFSFSTLKDSREVLTCSSTESNYFPFPCFDSLLKSLFDFPFPFSIRSLNDSILSVFSF